MDPLERIGRWRLANALRKVATCRGEACKFLTMVLAPGERLERVDRMLRDECGHLINIKARSTRKMTEHVLLMAIKRLRAEPQLPLNGLVLYCGEVLNDAGVVVSEVVLCFEPFRGLSPSLFVLDRTFHCQPIRDLLDTHYKFAFVVCDSRSALLATVQGDSRTVIDQFSVDIPAKRGRGGSSVERFRRLRIERLHYFERSLAEAAEKAWAVDGQTDVTGVVFAHSHDLAESVGSTGWLPRLLRMKLLRTIEISAGGDAGLAHAIDAASDLLRNPNVDREKRLVDSVLTHVASDTRMAVFGAEDTIDALQSATLETVLMFDGLDLVRVVGKGEAGNVRYLASEEARKLMEGRGEADVRETAVLAELLADHCTRFSTNLELISEDSPEGQQFVNGLGGLAGLRRCL